jgi:hypothetical protein
LWWEPSWSLVLKVYQCIERICPSSEYCTSQLRCRFQLPISLPRQYWSESCKYSGWWKSSIANDLFWFILRIQRFISEVYRKYGLQYFDQGKTVMVQSNMEILDHHDQVLYEVFVPKCPSAWKCKCRLHWFTFENAIFWCDVTIYIEMDNLFYHFKVLFKISSFNLLSFTISLVEQTVVPGNTVTVTNKMNWNPIMHDAILTPCM